jgi:predicted dehydrogenase
VETDWHALVERDDIDLVDICTPGDSHAVIAVAALQAGKHVLCEKPLANTVEEAEQRSAAARATGCRTSWPLPSGCSVRRNSPTAISTPTSR